MKKMFKRISAIALAAAMVLAMNTMAFADTAIPTSGKTGEVGTAADNVITIKKQITVINPESSAVYGPQVTYTYSIAPAAPTSATVTDKDNHKAAVKAGIADAVSFTDNTAAFANTATTTSAPAPGTASLEDTIKLTFTAANFGAAGVYRYKISESQPTNYAAAGLSRDTTNYVVDRYLDVYVQNLNNALAIYGYVLFEGSDNQSISSADETMKSEGWVLKSADTDLEDVDVFKTTNVTVSKTITGTLADMGNKFPFQINIAGSATDANAKIIVDGTATALTNGAYTNGTLAAGSTLKLGNSESVEIVGIPIAAGATAQANEFNNTPDTYTSKLNDATVAEFAAGASTSNAAQNLAETAKTTLAYTNNLDAVSPTGVVMRFAPYALILGAGIILLVLSRRRRAD